MTYVLSFIFVLGVLIFIHEFGHFLVAKWVGVRVERFSLGFPPNIISRKKGDTTYCIGIIPLGGYVKMAGDNPAEGRRGAPDEFLSKSISQRLAVIIAGPFMNYLLAIAILIGIFLLSGEPIFEAGRIVVGGVYNDSPAMKAGLRPNDVIIAIDGVPMTDFDSLRVRINSHLKQPLALTWIHGPDTVSRSIVAKDTVVLNAAGGKDTIGMIGFTQRVLEYRHLGLIPATERGFITAHVMVYETARFLKQLLTGQVSLRAIGGPVFIAQQSGKEARKGAASLFYFMALLSVNLAIINVLPIPILDGGHLLFSAIERLRGRPLSVKALMRAQQVGIVLLLGLIVLVTYNDILR